MGKVEEFGKNNLGGEMSSAKNRTMQCFLMGKSRSAWDDDIIPERGVWNIFVGVFGGERGGAYNQELLSDFALMLLSSRIEEFSEVISDIDFCFQDWDLNNAVIFHRLQHSAWNFLSFFASFFSFRSASFSANCFICRAS